MKGFWKALAVAGLVPVIAAGASSCVTMKPNEDLNDQMGEVLEGVDFSAGNDYKGSLQIMVMRTQSEQDNIKAFVDSFKVAYPNIDVRVDTSANYQEDLILQHAYATSQDKYDEMPDVLWLSNEDVPTYVAKGMLMPISYFGEQDKNFSFDSLVPTMVKDASYDGQVYFMPRDYNQITTFYNKTIFEKAGVPDPGTYKDENGQVRAMTKAEFTDMIEKIARWMRETKETTPAGKKYEDGRALEIQAFWNSLNYAVFKGNGAELVNGDGYIDLESEAALKTLYTFWDLAYNDICARMTDVGMSTHNLFIQGIGAVCFDVRSSLSDIVKSTDRIPGVCETLGVAPFPNLSDGEYYVGAGCSGYGMYRNSDDPTAAWLFLKHVVSESGQNAFCQTGNGCPVLKSMFDDKTATWKNIKAENPALYANLPADFDHDAFVYEYEQAGLTLDYLDKVPLGAQQAVTEEMRVAVINVVTSTPYDANINFVYQHMKNLLESSIEKMNDAIAKEKAKEEAKEEEKDEAKDEQGDGQQTEGNTEGEGA